MAHERIKLIGFPAKNGGLTVISSFLFPLDLTGKQLVFHARGPLEGGIVLKSGERVILESTISLPAESTDEDAWTVMTVSISDPIADSHVYEPGELEVSFVDAQGSSTQIGSLRFNHVPAPPLTEEERVTLEAAPHLAKHVCLRIQSGTGELLHAFYALDRTSVSQQGIDSLVWYEDLPSHIVNGAGENVSLAFIRANIHGLLRLPLGSFYSRPSVDRQEWGIARCGIGRYNLSIRQVVLGSSKLPAVSRYNAWGHWRPIKFADADQVTSFWKVLEGVQADATLQAAIAYNLIARSEGLEFVLLSDHWDAAKFRTHPNGITIVRVSDPPSDPRDRPFVCIYDGWLPLEDVSVDGLRNGIRLLQDLADQVGFEFGVRVRTHVKYTEYFERVPWMDTNDDDGERLRERIAKLSDLPQAVRTAVVRCMHWRQNALRQPRLSDRFVSLWLGLESLLLALFEKSGTMSLPLGGEAVPRSKAQREDERNRRVEALLSEGSALTASERVERAYFEGVVAQRGRIEMVLRALLGEDERIGWLYTGKNNPNKVRGSIVHSGWSEADATAACDLPQYCARLDGLIHEVVHRVTFRQWGASVTVPQRSVVVHATPMNNPMVGSQHISYGDYSISPDLLAQKGVIRF